MASTSINSLPDAQARISALESRLELVTKAVQRFSGLSLDELIAKYDSTIPSTPLSPSTPAAASSSSLPTSSASSATSTPVPLSADLEIDIAPLILQALSLRKKIAIAPTDEEEEKLKDEARALIGTPGLGMAQRQTLKEWAGMRNED